jgi:hypothetical protein
VPARRPGRQAHSVVGATITSGRAAAAFPGICPGRNRRGRGAACRMPCRSRDPVPPACLAAGRAPAGPRFRPGTGQARTPVLRTLSLERWQHPLRAATAHKISSRRSSSLRVWGGSS